MMNKKTLVILTPGFAKDEADTACLPLQQALVRHLDNLHANLQVVVLTFGRPFKKISYTLHGVRVIAVGGRNKGGIKRIYNWSRVWRQLEYLHKRENIIGLFSFWMGECAMVGQWFARKHKLRHLNWICGQDALAGNRYFRMVRPQAENLVTLSDFLAHTVERNYGIKPAYVIPGGLDAAHFQIDTPLERDIDVMAAGSLIKLKQFNLFIETVSRLRRTLPNVKAVLCGNGPDKARLELMIAQLHLEDNIILTGELPHPEVLALMQRTKVFLHPSKYEGQGMVMVEALYAGAKVISFVKPYDYHIDNWFHAGNTREMTKLTASILTSKWTRYACTAPFMIEDTARAILQIYDNELATSLKRPAIAPKESVVA